MLFAAHAQRYDSLNVTRCYGLLLHVLAGGTYWYGCIRSHLDSSQA